MLATLKRPFASGECNHRFTIIFGLASALCGALLLKIWLVTGGYVPFNSDEAIVALMARHITQGARPAFFYGQAYMGSLDALLVAAGFFIFGEQVWVIRLVQMVLYAGTILTTAWLGRKALGSWQLGVMAAWFLAVPTVNVTLYTTVSLGGYGEMLLLGNLILLTSLKLGEYLERGEGDKGWGLWLAWGVLSGMGLWAFGLTLVYSVPAGIYLIWKAGRAEGWKAGRVEGWKVGGGAAGLVIVGGLVGAGPWWLYAVRHGFGGLLRELQGGAIAGVEGLTWVQGVWQHSLNFVILGSTVIFGLRPPWEVRWLALPVLPFALMFWIAVLVFTFKRLGAGQRNRAEAWLIAGTGITLILGFLLTPFGADPSGRYFVPLAIPLALFAAETIMHARAQWGGWAIGVAGFILIFNLAGTVQSGLTYPPGITTQFDAVAQVDHRYDEALMAFLEAQGETRGYTNYWVAYPLAFKSKEALIFVPRLPYHEDFRYTRRDDRYAAYGELVAESQRVAYITTNHPELDEYLRISFAKAGIAWQEARIGDFQVFYELSRAVRPGEIGLGEDMPLGMASSEHGG